MKHFPLLLNGGAVRALVVGANPHALAKARLLLDAGARVTLIGTPEDEGATRPLLERVVWRRRQFAVSDLGDHNLVYIATGRSADDKRIASLANEQGIFANVIDDVKASQFSTPAVVRRGDLLVTISTSGKSPALAARLRHLIEILLPGAFDETVRFLTYFRTTLRQSTADFDSRNRFWRSLFGGEMGALIAANGNFSGEEPSHFWEPDGSTGRLTIVGAGPGDPELLTLKAVRAIGKADVILYDRLVSEEIFRFARRDAELIFVGKMPGQATTRQAEINALMHAHFRAGKNVVRLKGGDPSLFSRLDEELDALHDANIPVQIVPGVSSAGAAAAASLSPLTARGKADAITFLTASRSDGRATDWRRFANEETTLAIFMGVGSAGDIAEGLMGVGRDAQTPVVIVEQATKSDERQIETSLGRLAHTIVAKKIAAPAMLLVGTSLRRATRLASTYVDFAESASGYLPIAAE
jgi:uroporphyrin-III C-methyltransferase/precorrin-2 dehydrogenase/sirohydrochlorin ferrochelatase